MGDRLPLEGIEVLEVTDGVAGAWCGRLLALYGATVLKVEPPGGDPMRRVEPLLAAATGPTGVQFAYLDAGKQSVTLDIDSPQGFELFCRLAASADVVVDARCETTAPGLAAGYDVLAVDNPGLIWAAISPFGRSGPYANYQSSPLVEWALSGQAYITGEPDREPLQAGGHQPEYQAGVHAAIAILSALYWRGRTGQGQFTEISALEGLAALHQWTTVDYTHLGVIKRREGQVHGEFTYPMGPMRCADGYVCPGTVTPAQWEGLCIAAGMPELIDDPRFVSGPDRVDNAVALQEALRPWLESRTGDEIQEACQELSVPCARLLDTLQILEDAQLAYRDYWAGEAAIRYPLAPFRFEGLAMTAAPAPAAGSANAEVLGGRLGLQAGELAELAAAGVV
jgi:formyl-CoA transferase